MGIINKIRKSEDEKQQVQQGADDIKADKQTVVSTKNVSKVAKSEQKKEEKKSVKNGKVSDYKLLERPLITEKVTDLVVLKKYVFAVPTDATKSEIGKAVENIYGVSPVKVNIVNQKGKSVRHGRIRGKRKDWKKAIITLGGEDKIEIYEGV